MNYLSPNALSTRYLGIVHNTMDTGSRYPEHLLHLEELRKATPQNIEIVG